MIMQNKYDVSKKTFKRKPGKRQIMFQAVLQNVIYMRLDTAILIAKEKMVKQTTENLPARSNVIFQHGVVLQGNA